MDFVFDFEVVLINMLAVLMMSAKFITLGLLKIEIPWNKFQDAKISFHDITNQVLSRDYSNYIVDVSCDQRLVTLAFLWKKLS